MPIEIERKFLVLTEAWRTGVSVRLRHLQNYLSRTSRATVRVRWAATYATITVKGRRNGIAREEYEYPIPVEQAEAMLSRLCPGPPLEKVRHWVPHEGLTWQVDEYLGRAAGLVVAEIELEHPDQPFPLPAWIGAEITHDPRYRNSAIARRSWRNPQRSVDDSRLAGGGSNSAHRPYLSAPS